MVSRRNFIKVGLAGSLALATQGMVVAGNPGKGRSGKSTISTSGDTVIKIFSDQIKAPVKLMVISDTHLWMSDEREDPFRQYSDRMSKAYNQTKDFQTLADTNPAEEFEKTLALTSKMSPDAIIILGDLVSYPSEAAIEWAKTRLDATGIPYYYTNGNHDWHFEGVPSSDAAQREEWIPKRLMPLYGADVDPLAYSKVVKGIRFVAIDNSIYHVTERQLAFWRSEIAKGDPTVLLMHIPLWMDGFEICTCGNPNWGAAADRIWEIERREKWAERQSAESFALRSDVLEAPNLIAVLTGHLHRWMSASHNGRLMFSAPHGKDGFACDIRIAPAF